MQQQEASQKQIAATMESTLSNLRSGDEKTFETMIQMYNQRLYRIARSIVRDDMEAEDIVQESYIKAFTRLDQFEGGQKEFGSWLARITTNLAIDRTRKSKRANQLVTDLLDSFKSNFGETFTMPASNTPSPEKQVAMSEIKSLLEQEIDKLPDGFREVFIFRIVEEMTIEETSDILQIPLATVKTRLHRARAKLQASLKEQLTAASLTVFPFAGARCNRITAHVLSDLKDRGVILQQ